MDCELNGQIGVVFTVLDAGTADVHHERGAPSQKKPRHESPTQASTRAGERRAERRRAGYSYEVGGFIAKKLDKKCFLDDFK